MRAFGTIQFGVFRGLLAQISHVSRRRGKPDERTANFIVQTLASLQPRDEAEAMLIIQMAAVHSAAIGQLALMANATIPERETAAERAAGRLMRAYSTQMRTLRKYRSGGEQHVTVEHVHVHEGGQAIVGAVKGGGYGKD